MVELLSREVARDGVTADDGDPPRGNSRRRCGRPGRPTTTYSVEEVSAESTSSIPVGRYGTPEEYADVVAFLASERASYLTGSIIRVDGGLIASI